MIPLSVPHIAGNEWQYVKDCLDTGWVSSAGTFVNQFEKLVADYSGSRYGVACMNGTSALHVSLRLAGVQPNDYVIVPNITFVASVNAIKYSGADPILIDADPSTWQMNLDLLEEFLSRHTCFNDKGELQHIRNGRRIAAIMPVHVLGNICNMDRLMVLAHQYRLAVVEDASESLGSYYKGKHSGTFGKMGCFSFNGNKIITTGGGGVIVTDDEELAMRARHLTTQAKISHDEYIHDEVGFNYRMVNVLAAIGVAQMEQLPEFILRKKEIDAFYREQLCGIADIACQKVASGVDPNCWLFTFRTSRMRELLDYLNANGVQSRPFWMPMNQLPMFSRELYFHHSDHSAAIYNSSLSIPSSVNLTDDQLERVVSLIREFFRHSVRKNLRNRSMKKKVVKEE